ncbi:hypothetical protein M1D80_09430 [Phyllobacteriaceae bacterium JZ32]
MANYYDIEETISGKLEGNAHWRASTGERFPDDARNAEAAKKSNVLSKQVAVSAHWRDLYSQGMQLIEVMGERDDSILHELFEAESEVFRRIGFGSEPETHDEIAEELCDAVQRVADKRLKAFEAHLRRKARALNYRLVKSRAKNVTANNHKGFMIIAEHSNTVVDGDKFDLSAADVAERLDREQAA